MEVLPEIWFGSLERPAESPLLQWFPIVTAPQVGIDMMFAATVGTRARPRGGGLHRGMEAVTAPQNWTGEDAGRLATELETEAAWHSGSWSTRRTATFL